MTTLTAQWAQWSSRFSALARRERLVVALAAIAGGGLLGFTYGVEPLLIKSRGASRAEATALAELTRLQVEITGLKGLEADPDAAKRQRLEQARKEYAAVAERLAVFESGMVPPARMQAFLERLLARNSGVELLGLKTLPAVPVGTSLPPSPGLALPKPEPRAEVPTVAGQVADTANAITAKATAAPAPAQGAGRQAATPDGIAAPGGEGIYQHGIELRIAGSYADLLHYVEDIERSSQRVLWHSLVLTADKYPRNVMVLRVYTLSLDRKWLTV